MLLAKIESDQAFLSLCQNSLDFTLLTLLYGISKNLSFQGKFFSSLFLLVQAVVQPLYCKKPKQIFWYMVRLPDKHIFKYYTYIGTKIINTLQKE